ncbi:PapB/FocB family fimbrial expression transcriptional regulator [Aliidiomarina maris]|uniref:Adhesin biosynthesis transcription regulatory protein n=1 Tax=Aliidiomarina maris TaxID=531312 RepID=A0A327X7M1_9GAMM|nr:PapB/FocB family fimbrial expression transcriptional regulator [Aliidiomarina maris]RAK01652.1 adhesin biosynthesis transcription regulatory protein [Aliidiomarina maris]RUO28476.1 hypothetical protein CWE07_01315 [Aliidiomarina maris]
MKYLLAGKQSPDRFELLLSLTKISSESVVSALRDYLVVGHSEVAAALINQVSSSNFNRALNKMNDVAKTVEHIKELDWAHLKSVK